MPREVGSGYMASVHRWTGDTDMPFEPLNTAGRGGAMGIGSPNNVVVSLTTTDAENGRLGLTIRIGERLLDHLGWKRPSRVMIFEGTGREAGILKLVQCDADQRRSYALSGFGAHSKAASIKVSMGMLRWHKAPPTKHGQTEVVHQAFGGELLIILPEWVQRVSVKEAA